MMVYKRKTGVAESYDYKCTAPGKAREDMFMNEGNRSSYGELTTNVLLVCFDEICVTNRRHSYSFKFCSHKNI